MFAQLFPTVLRLEYLGSEVPHRVAVVLEEARAGAAAPTRPNHWGGFKSVGGERQDARLTKKATSVAFWSGDLLKTVCGRLTDSIVPCKGSIDEGEV